MSSATLGPNLASMTLRMQAWISSACAAVAVLPVPIAQGRVWMGSDALDISLVDEIGTLEDAIAYAAGLAGLYSSDQYKVVSYPKPLTFAEQLMATMGQTLEEPSILSDTPFKSLEGAVKKITASQPTEVYARMPYNLVIR